MKSNAVPGQGTEVKVSDEAAVSAAPAEVKVHMKLLDRLRRLRSECSWMEVTCRAGEMRGMGLANGWDFLCDLWGSLNYWSG